MPSSSSRPPGFGVIWTTVAMDLVGFGIIIPVLPLYAEDFGASPLLAAALLAAFSAAQMVAAPLWGRLSDRIGRKPVLIAALIGSALGSLVTGLAGVLWVLFAGRLLDGASGSSYAVGQAAVADMAEPQDRPRLLGLLAAAFGVGFVVGPLLGSFAALGGRQLPFFIASGLAAVNALVALVRLPNQKPVATAKSSQKFFSGLKDSAGQVRRLALLALIAMVAFAGFEATFALFLERRFPQLDDPSVYGLFALIGLGLVLVQTRVVGPVNARMDSFSVLRLALGLMAMGMALLAMGGAWVGLTLALVALVLGQGLFNPSLSAATVTAVGQTRRGAALGVQQSAGALGRVAGPLLAGVLFSRASTEAPYWVAALLAVVAVGLVPAEVKSNSAS
ncbi:MAG TPA: MFS transporter [Acidimicrobiia bacterium]|jgi:MFS family permease|nr:MFS transporter [Acidimicrobiia bacterium]HIL46955.1 MFS transporter [Acidimicrobiia bacterium]